MIHLKIRTEYSFGKTYAPIKRVIERLKEIGCTAAGIVDGSTWGHVKWHEACCAAGIQPLLGFEVVVSDDEAQTKMWFLAKNASGLSAMYHWNSISYGQQMKHKGLGSVPRLYTDQVEEMMARNEIVAFSGDVVDGGFLSAINAVVDINPSSFVLNAKKMQLAEKLNLRIVSTADNYYCYDGDDEIFEILARGGKRMTQQFIPDSLEHQEQSELIALSCSTFELPKATMIRVEGDLERLCRDGITFRKMDSVWNNVYEERLKYEIDLIKSKDFESYFIIVADMVHYAKKHMLVGPSRGSAAGSLVCYLSRITEIDPVKAGLFFERFIDLNRTDLPDIDLDFPDNKRHMVFDYMEKKYGEGRTAHIGTVSVYKPKSALIQTCKSLDIPAKATGAVKVAMIERSSADARASNCLEDTLKNTDPGRQLLTMYPEVEIACKLEGHASHVGVHAAGLLVCNEPITNFCTVDADGIAHTDKISAEKINLLKIDVLGLRTLGILEDTGLAIDWYNMSFDDPKVYDLFNSHKYCGIFQFEGDAMRSLSENIHFKTLTDVDNVTALSRPGPYGAGVVQKYLERKKGARYEALHPVVEKFMEETFGLPIYQEQTLAIVRHIGKFSWKDTSTIRKAMSKRMGKEFFDSFWLTFKNGAAEWGIAESDARVTWELINSMGSWQMNKAHTYSYAVISYWCAWLKTYHPLEFYAATLRSAKDDDSAIELLREMSRDGIKYIPFDIETSEVNWSVKNGQLIGGFTTLDGIGEAKALKYVEKRNAHSLSAKERDAILSKKNKFAEIFPFHTYYGDMYINPGSFNIASPVVDIETIKEGIPHCANRVFLGELIQKSHRDINEEVFVKRRGGKKEGKPYDFLDLIIRDDTGMIRGRIKREIFESIGKELLEKVPEGAHLMIRASFYNGIRYAYITKWKRIDESN